MPCIEFKDETLLTELEDEIVLLNSNEGVYYSLDSIGKKMVELCLELDSFDQVIEQLLSAYDTDRNQLEIDLPNLIESLKLEKLIK